MELNIYEETRKIWDTISTDENIENLHFNIQAHKKLLDVFQVGEYYYFILNVRNSKLELISPEVEQILGYKPEDISLPVFMELMHPEDRPHYLNFEVAIGDFFNSISGDRLFRYKVQHDFRVKRADGTYIRVLNQFVILQHDEDCVRTFVVNTDISHLKKDSRPELSFIGLEGEPSFINVEVKDVYKLHKPILSRRERDVLKALAKGMSSSEISDMLHISKHTVDSHRKNMLRKTGAKSTAEVLQVALSNGWV